MNPKRLSLIVLALAVVSGLIAWLQRPAPPAETDPLVGQKLLDAATANSATTITFTRNADTVELSLTENGNWTVVSYHNLPADEEKLRRFVGELADAEIERVVTRNPETQARLDLDDTTLTIASTSGERWTAHLGKTADHGGRYVKLADAANAPAYLARLSAYFDFASKNWADSKLIGFTAPDIQSVALTFDDGTTVNATRASSDAEWTSPDTPAGQQFRGARISSLLTTLTNLRFTDTAAPDAPDVVDARAHERTANVTTFDGETVTIALGRRPEQILAKEPVDSAATPTDAEAAPAEAETETIPAGPVFVRIDGPVVLAPLTGKPLAFKIADYSFTSLPANRADLFEPAVPADPSARPTPLAPDA